MSVAGRALGMDCYDAMNLDDTALTLGLPGGVTRGSKLVVKRVFSETIDLSLGRGSLEDGDAKVAKASDARLSEAITSKPPPAAKTQVIGWPPVKLPRKNNAITKSCKFVKVAVDGAPYLRKVDLETYNSYEQLLDALENMFSCFTIRKDSSERELMDLASRGQYMPTYEDKDEDWMLVGDVPWKTFIDSCKRIRLMKSSEEIRLAAPRGSVSTCKSSCSCA